MSTVPQLCVCAAHHPWFSCWDPHYMCVDFRASDLGFSSLCSLSLYLYNFPFPVGELLCYALIATWQLPTNYLLKQVSATPNLFITASVTFSFGITVLCFFWWFLFFHLKSIDFLSQTVLLHKFTVLLHFNWKCKSRFSNNSVFFLESVCCSGSKRNQVRGNFFLPDYPNKGKSTQHWESLRLLASH